MKYAICNELFGKMDFKSGCQLISKHGYTGIEIAPFTIFSNQYELDNLNFLKINQIKSVLKKNNLQFVGFHWLFSGFSGFHLFSSDSKVREKTYNHLKKLINLVGELGGGVLILGSPEERKILNMSVEKAERILVERLKELSSHLKNNGAMILLEALPRKYTNIINTLEQAKNMIGKINSEQVKGMFDFHNCTDEKQTWAELIDQYFTMIKHVHLNEIDGSYPGLGTSDFLPAFRVMEKRKYKHWISMEVFEKPKDAEYVICQVRNYLHMIEQKL
jgi:D-psicose/D-tagatose/L-ribulose 3-epimerase